MNEAPVPILSYHQGRFADWDFLIILDACRYDVFAEVINELHLPGVLTKVDSSAENASSWYRNHWSQEDTDAILISANPWSFKDDASNNASRRFRKAIWADPEGRDIRDYKSIRARIEPLCRQSEGFGVFHPRVCLERFSAYKVPGLRYVIHLIPPHLPYIGEKGKALFERLKLQPYPHGGIYRAIREYGRKGSWDELRCCYKESLIAAILTLADYVNLFLDGRLVMTSDHGELIGEPGFDENGWYWHKISGDT